MVDTIFKSTCCTRQLWLSNAKLAQDTCTYYTWQDGDGIGDTVQSHKPIMVRSRARLLDP
jgi:hypothetical protein